MTDCPKCADMRDRLAAEEAREKKSRESKERTVASLEERIQALEAAVASLEYWRAFRDREDR